jgi:hypothetical protein
LEPGPFALSELLQDEAGALALPEGKAGEGAVGRPLFERHLAREVQSHPRSSKDHPAPDELDLVPLSGVVEGRAAINLEEHPPPYDPHVADQVVVRRAPSLDGHKVEHLGYALRGEKAG